MEKAKRKLISWSSRWHEAAASSRAGDRSRGWDHGRDFQRWHLSGLCSAPAVVSESGGVPDHFQEFEGTVLPARVAKPLSLGPPLLQGWMAAARVRTRAEGWGQEQDAKALSLSSLTVSPPVPC